MRKTITAIGLFALLGVRPARADDRAFSNFCLVGAVRTCASIDLHTTAILDGGGHQIGTAVVLRVRNLEGINLADNTGGSVITQVGLTQPVIGTVSNFGVTSSGAAGVIGTPQGNWVANGKALGGQVTFSAGLDNVGTRQSQLNGGILGCHNPQGFASMNEYFRTCADGWVVFSFNSAGIWTASQAQVAWKIQSATINGQSYECRTADLTCVTSVVPEPRTVALLGTGLLWMAGWVRRRKGPVVVDA